MSKQNFKSQAKRKRELAKLDKRQAKDQKRAAKKAEGSDAGAVVAAVAAVGPSLAVSRALAPTAVSRALAPTAAPVAAPLTLAQVVERWKNTKIVKPKHRGAASHSLDGKLKHRREPSSASAWRRAGAPLNHVQVVVPVRI